MPPAISLVTQRRPSTGITPMHRALGSGLLLIAATGIPMPSAWAGAEGLNRPLAIVSSVAAGCRAGDGVAGNTAMLVGTLTGLLVGIFGLAMLGPRSTERESVSGLVHVVTGAAIITVAALLFGG